MPQVRDSVSDYHLRESDLTGYLRGKFGGSYDFRVEVRIQFYLQDPVVCNHDSSDQNASAEMINIDSASPEDSHP